MAFDFGFEKMVKAFRPEKTIESCEGYFNNDIFEKDVVPAFMDRNDISTKTIADAAKQACEFFGLPEIPVVETNINGVITGDLMTFNDDVFLYNKAKLKRVKLDNPTDITKVYIHECGHRISQFYFGGVGSWANELCADFFVGAFNEKLGLKSSNYEKFIAKERATETHPEGAMRLKALEYGKKCVADMKTKNIKPTWENLMEKFKETNADKLGFCNFRAPEMARIFSSEALGLSSDFHLERADYYKRQNDWKTKEMNRRIEKGDINGAKDMSISAKYDRKHMDEHIACAKREMKKGK